MKLFLRNIIVVSVVILAVVICIFVLHGVYSKSRGHPDDVARAGAFSASSATNTGNRFNKADTNITSATTQQSARPVTVADLPEEARSLFLTGYRMGLEENKPIKFYGKVIDQNYSVISGVSIEAAVLSFDPSILQDIARDDRKQTAVRVQTDDKGGFAITGEHGFNLHIVSLQKDGYEADPHATSWFNYSEHYGGVYQPDASNPVVFKMWKRGPSEQLILVEKNKQIISDGRVYTLDLLKGKIIEGTVEGDLLIRANMPRRADRAAPRYPWSYNIEAIDGGILLTEDTFLYLAPAEGYQPLLTFTIDPSKPDWSKDMQKRFYIRSRGGKVISGLELGVLSTRLDTGLVIIKSRANPAGSPNLQ